MNNIFSEWRLREPHLEQRFIEDGIIDFKKWEKSPRKVLFLLKEAYDTNQDSSGFSLTTLVREKWKGPKGTTWWRMGYWAYLLQNISISNLPDYPANKREAKEALLSSAVVNIRKSGGKKKSDPKVIAEYATRDRDLLRRQIDDISPNFVVCGGTWPQTKHIWPYASGVSSRFLRNDEINIINFWHPATRWNNHLMYFSLGGICLAGLACRSNV